MKDITAKYTNDQIDRIGTAVASAGGWTPASMGRKGGLTKGPTKARDPEKMRAAARTRWAKHRNKWLAARAHEIAMQPQARAANDSRYYMQDQFDGTFTLRRSDSFEAVASGLTRAQAEAAVRAANAAKLPSIPTHEFLRP